MDDGFELLEEKVHKAAETVKRLREEKQALERERKDLQHRLQELEKAASARTAAPAPSPADQRRLESLTQELKQMQQERDQIKKRIGSLLDVLEGLDSL